MKRAPAKRAAGSAVRASCLECSGVASVSEVLTVGF
jgi:hypothetical protein